MQGLGVTTRSPLLMLLLMMSTMRINPNQCHNVLLLSPHRRCRTDLASPPPFSRPTCFPQRRFGYIIVSKSESPSRSGKIRPTMGFVVFVMHHLPPPVGSGLLSGPDAAAEAPTAHAPSSTCSLTSQAQKQPFRRIT